MHNVLFLLPIIQPSSNIIYYINYAACYRFVTAAYINLFYFDVCVSRMDLPTGLKPGSVWTYVCNFNRFADDDDDDSNNNNVRYTVDLKTV